jgi:EAL domain-containing protein (putative c-di-GMP-specific phosphodiesterase class I)
MGQALRLQTVAEGVETGHHVIELRELACDVALAPCPLSRA